VFISASVWFILAFFSGSSSLFYGNQGGNTDFKSQ